MSEAETRKTIETALLGIMGACATILNIVRSQDHQVYETEEELAAELRRIKEETDE